MMGQRAGKGVAERRSGSCSSSLRFGVFESCGDLLHGLQGLLLRNLLFRRLATLSDPVADFVGKPRETL